MQQNWQCRWSPTLGKLEDSAENIWGTDLYTDLDKPAVFFGIYGVPDWYALWRHRGKKAILWAGTDIRHLVANYWLDETGKIRIDNKGMCEWMNRYCENYCENKVEQWLLKSVGIEAKVRPSFLGDVSKFEVSFKPGNKVYASISGDNFDLYGWPEIEQAAEVMPHLEFHLYGNNALWRTKNYNVIVHGRVSKEQMNEEIKEMQCGLRLVRFDGMSEILVKSVLWGQWPVSFIPYPHILNLGGLRDIDKKTKPNLAGRNYYLKNLNNFPWNRNK